MDSSSRVQLPARERALLDWVREGSKGTKPKKQRALANAGAKSKKVASNRKRNKLARKSRRKNR